MKRILLYAIRSPMTRNMNDCWMSWEKKRNQIHFFSLLLLLLYYSIAFYPLFLLQLTQFMCVWWRESPVKRYKTNEIFLFRLMQTDILMKTFMYNTYNSKYIPMLEIYIISCCELNEIAKYRTKNTETNRRIIIPNFEMVLHTQNVLLLLFCLVVGELV